MTEVGQSRPRRIICKIHCNQEQSKRVLFEQLSKSIIWSQYKSENNGSHPTESYQSSVMPTDSTSPEVITPNCAYLGA